MLTALRRSILPHYQPTTWSCWLQNSFSLYLSYFPLCCSPLDPRGRSLCKTPLKTSAACSCPWSSPEDFEVPDFTHTAYGACPNCSRLRPRKLENPTKDRGQETGLTLLSLLEGFSARCSDCAGWWSYRNKKLLSFSLLEVSDERKNQRMKEEKKFSKRSKWNPSSGWWVRGSHDKENEEQ